MFLNMIVTQEMVTSSGGSLTIIKEELSYWWDEYGVYMLGIPDIMIDGIPEIPLIGDIIDLLLLGPLWDLIKLKIKEWLAEVFNLISIFSPYSSTTAICIFYSFVLSKNIRFADK